jgi:hypothetical protein
MVETQSSHRLQRRSGCTDFGLVLLLNCLPSLLDKDLREKTFLFLVVFLPYFEAASL